ncbi:AAA family ATPase [Candidatus Uhrbacteria bacterium]|nr:AAA family ATPase [Candidatus Uhrbacteria bacterium]
MYLTKLEIHGFKSFANKATLTVAPPKSSFPITAIVGPNGSGKSNVVDAMRWVLGEQSMKHLRGKKSEDVIFSGSETKSRLGYAEVAMTLDNTDRSMPVDFPEVVIARRYYRDGESEYLLNNRQVRLADITMLLAQSHMGQRSYSVIGQGMVDHLLMATPRERKEMIDEAAGVRPYELKCNDALNRMATTRENLLQGQTVLNEIEPRMRTLTRMVKRLERRAELERTLNECIREYYGALWKESVAVLAKAKQRVEELEPQLASVLHKRSSMDAQLKTMEKEAPVSSQVIELQKSIDGYQQTREKLKEQLWRIKAQHQASPVQAATMAMVEQELATLITTYEQATTLEQFHQCIHDLRKLLKRLKPATPAPATPSPEITPLEGQLTAIEQQITNARTQMQTIEQQDHDSRQALFRLQRELRELDGQRERLSRTKQDFAIEEARAEAHHEDLVREIRGAMNGEPSVVLAGPLPAPRKPLNELQSDIRRLQHEIELIGGIDPEIQQEYETTKERFEFLTKQTEDLTKALAELEQVIENLDKTMQHQFNNAFGLISKEFSKYFTELFGGGKAELVLLEPEPEIEKEIESGEGQGEASAEFPRPRGEGRGEGVVGIDISASPPGKRLKSVALLSGGEKALTAIALLCAILSFHPSPFVVLDEVDAALDEANSLRYANILKQLAQKTQFFVVTHNRTTMHIAHTFYGVTMGADGISQVLSLKMEEAEETTPAA